MNKRIRELAEQAGFIVDQSNCIMVCFTSDGDSEVKKFAELIVQDCLCMADEFELEANRSGLVYRMTEHFGVKK